jgi:hypothetical protein
VDSFDAWIGLAVRWAACVAAVSWVVYAAANFGWHRASMAWRLAALAVLRQDAVRAEIERRRAAGRGGET